MKHFDKSAVTDVVRIITASTMAMPLKLRVRKKRLAKHWRAVNRNYKRMLDHHLVWRWGGREANERGTVYWVAARMHHRRAGLTKGPAR